MPCLSAGLISDYYELWQIDMFANIASEELVDLFQQARVCKSFFVRHFTDGDQVSMWSRETSIVSWCCRGKKSK